MLKKILLTALCFLSIGVRAELYTGGVADVTNGLVAHWKLDELSYNGTAGEVKDSSGNGKHGISYKKVITNPGKIKRAAYFDGSGASIYNNDLYLPTNNTISGWVKIPRLVGGGVLFGYESGILPQCSFSVATEPNRIMFKRWDYVENTEDANGYMITVADAVETNAWYFLAVTSTNFISTVYLNGIDVGFVNYETYEFALSGFSIGSFLDWNWKVGESIVDDVRIYDRALSPDEVSRLYLLGSKQKKQTVVYQSNTTPYENLPTNGLIAHWKLDEMSYNGTTGEVKDSSGNGYDGVATAPIISNPSKFTRSAIFNETAALSIPSASDIFGGSAPRTVSFWAKRGSFANDNHGLISFGDGTTRQFWFFIGHAQQDDVVVQINTTINGYVAIDVENSFPQNTWTHFVCLIDQFTLKLYTNSVFCAQTGFSGEIVAGNTSNFIGDIPPFNKFNGGIDDVRIYNRALSPGEIKALYNAKPVEESVAAVYADNILVSNPLKKDYSKTKYQNVTNGLMAWWKLDEMSYNGTAGEVKDSSGNGLDGTTTGKVITNPSKLGRAALFNDSLFATTSPINEPENQFTVSLWIRCKYGIAPYAVMGNFMYHQYGFSIFTWADGYIGYGFNTSGGSIERVPVHYADNELFHLSIVKNGDHILSYKNGELKDDYTSSITYTPSLIGMRVGGSTQGGWEELSKGINGSIDDLRIYNRALTAEEIQILYKYREE